MASHGPSGRNLDPGIRLVLEELRDLRVEMRADRRRADEDRRRADEDRRRADEERRLADKERRLADEARREERRQSDERFEKALRETRRAFNDVRSVGLSIVKTLNRHTRILERIERRLGDRGRWPPGNARGNGAHR